LILKQAAFLVVPPLPLVKKAKDKNKKTKVTNKIEFVLTEKIPQYRYNTNLQAQGHYVL
jgi:hypothetical protein